MANTKFMREVADYIDAHPDEYDFGWHNCVAGHAVRLSGGQFIDETETLRPNESDPPDEVRDDWSNADYVRVEDRARRLFGITNREAFNLFIYQFDESGEIDSYDPHAVADYVRRMADRLDAGLGVGVSDVGNG